jgi:hypothetical protein
LLRFGDVSRKIAMNVHELETLVAALESLAGTKPAAPRVFTLADRPQWAIDRALQIEDLQRRGWPRGAFQYWTEAEVQQEHELLRTYNDWKIAQRVATIEELLNVTS